jgi:hypothetical protein
MFDPTESNIWICLLPTKDQPKKCWNATQNTEGMHKQVDWLSNRMIVVASNKAGTYPPMSTKGRNFYRDHPATQLWRTEIGAYGQLTEWFNMTPDQYFVMTPEVFSNGVTCYSSWHGEAPREFGSTPQNQWWIDCRDINGQPFPHAFLNAHGSPKTLSTRSRLKGVIQTPPRIGDEGATAIRGLRGLAELWIDYLAVGNYYRSNSIGPNGETLGMEMDWNSEGCSKEIDMTGVDGKNDKAGSGQFTNCTLQVLTPYALATDKREPKFHVNGKPMGRSGNPFALPDKDGQKRWGHTQSRGYCYRVAAESIEFPGVHMATKKAMHGEPTCKKQINENLRLVVTDPFDKKQTRCIAGCDLSVHAFDAQYAGPYSDLYSIDTPAIAEIKPPAKECFLQVVNAFKGELDQNPVWASQPKEKREEYRVAFQGNSIHQSELKETLKFFGVETFEHWKKPPSREGLNITGTYTTKIMPDGSVRLKVPCGTPFQHFGYDANMNKVSNGLAPLAINQTITCFGCHDGHSQRRAAELYKHGTPEQQFRKTQAAQSIQRPPAGC